MDKLNIKEQVHHIIDKYGRMIDQTFFLYLFEDGDQNDVIDALSAYQNEDGGFGHGLEPDYLNPNSSAIQCFTALSYLRKLNMDSNHQMIINLLKYFESSYQKDIRRWLIKVPSNNDYPHAPWWHDDHSIDTSFNPSASIASFILLHANPNDLVYGYAKEVIYDAMIYLQLTEDPIEMHEMRCFLDLVNDLILLGGKDILGEAIQHKLEVHLEKLINLDESTWFTSYVCKPTQLFKYHPSFGTDKYEYPIKKELELSLLYRDNDGAWPITWVWDSYPEAFRKAQAAWKAVIAIEYLSLMKDFDMMI